MSVAREVGAAVANGLGIASSRGACFHDMDGRGPDVDVMRRSLEEAVYGSGE